MSIALKFPKESPKNLNAVTSKYIEDAALTAIMKKYCDYLLFDKNMAPKESMKEVDKIMTVMVERGETSIASMESIHQYIISANSIKVSTMDQITMRAFEEVQINTSVEEGSPLKMLVEHRELERRYRRSQQNVVSYFGANNQSSISKVINSYNKMFDSNFVAQFKKQ